VILYENWKTDAGKSAAEKDLKRLEAINEDVSARSTKRPGRSQRRASASMVSRRGTLNGDTPSKLKQVRRRVSANMVDGRKDSKVRFGRVSAREYQRCLGTDTVPTEGFWPLGLSNEVVRNVELGSVRSIQKSKKYSSFSMCDEDQRKELVRASSSHFEKNGASTKKSSKKLSGKNSSENLQNLVSEKEIEDLNNEIELLRTERCKKNQGCACKKKPNMMLAKGKYGKKKVFTERRLKDELKLRGRNKDACKSRAEMEEILTHLIDQDPCCGEDCPCVKNGIGCHENACSCWRDIGDRCTVDEINRSCGNKFGMEVMDVDEIRSHSAKVLEDVNK